MRGFLLAIVLFGCVISLAAPFSVGILITGEIGGNAIYELVQQGAQRAAGDAIEIRIVEGGYNQSKWEPLLLSMAATGKYDLLMTFTEGMPASVAKVARAFPNQKFTLLDGIVPEPLANVYSVAFKDGEMTFLAGVLAGMITSSGIGGTNPEKTVGLIAGDTYPAMINTMKPAYEAGVKSIEPEATVLFGIVGSWSDPTRGRELASRQYEGMADIILVIAGGSGMGSIEEAAGRGRYVITVDSNALAMKPGVILASFLKHIDLLVYETIIKAGEGSLPFGSNSRVGISEGMIDYTRDDPLFIKYVPEEIREKMFQWYESIKNGGLPAF